MSLFQQLKEAKRLTIEKIASCLLQQVMRSQCCTVIGQPHKLRELIKPTYVRLSASLGKVAGPWSNDFLSLLTAGGARRLPTRVTLSSYRLEPNWEGTV